MEAEKNGKTLIIVESPTKAKTIKKFLPSNCTVIACNGHIRDLPVDDLSIDVAAGYKPKYVIAAGKDKLIKTIKSELKDASYLLLATDEDREGESISWHLLEVLHPTVPYQRMVFHEITKRAILQALEHGRELDMALVRAQEARRILDRLYGYTLSPLLWKKLSNKNLSAGRVQSPGLRLIVDRERQRICFVKSTYWDAKALLAKQSGSKASFEAKLETVNALRVAGSKDFDSTTGQLSASKQLLLLDEAAATALVEKLKDASWKVDEVREKPVTSRPAPPFITSTLQQEGNRKLRLSAKDTMKIAQKLYENGFITYMRTDSPTLSQEGIAAARRSVESLYGASFLSPAPRQYSAKSASAQEAHEAIRPAGDEFVHPEKTGLHGRELALYEMIWKRTLACQMADAKKSSTTVKVLATCKDGETARFGATGTRILFPGFIRVYVEGVDDPEAALDDKEVLLPDLSEGEALELNELTPVSHETKPPARFTEATLVQELEKMGIGRPSTYATIIDKLFERKYVVKDGTAMIPTFTGFGVVQLLEDNFSTMVDYGFTSTMEDGLDRIATEDINELQFLKGFYEGDSGLLHQVQERSAAIKPAVAKQISLPQISSEHPVMIGPYGAYVIGPKVDGKDQFISLPATMFPGTITDADIVALLKQGKEQPEGLKSVGTDPATGLPVLLMSGRFGDYWQLGEKSEANPEPKRASVPKGKKAESFELSKILQFFQLPRTIGVNPSNNEPVVANRGKYGPYVGNAGEFRSLADEDRMFTISLDEALALLAAPKPGRNAARGGKGGGSDGGSGKASAKASSPALIELGEYEGQKVGVLSGRYGFYLKHGKDNYALPYAMKKNEDALKQLTLDQAVEIIKNKK